MENVLVGGVSLFARIIEKNLKKKAKDTMKKLIV